MRTSNNGHINQAGFSKVDFDRLTTSEKADLFVGGYCVLQKRSKAEALELLRSKMEKESRQTPVRSLRLFWSAAASVAVIAILTSLYLYKTPAQIVASRGQHLEYALPDGSNVNINADSKLTFAESSFSKKRILKLDGEAYFSVQKGSPFVVKTPSGTIEVLGTTLNIYARNDAFNVSCLTGKVKVTSNNQTVILSPGEKAELVSGTLQKFSNLSDKQLAGWKTGEFHFESKPLISIFEEIERQFNVNISASGIGNRFYTGSFFNQNLTDALEMVCLPMSLEYEIKNGNKIFIKVKKK